MARLAPPRRTQSLVAALALAAATAAVLGQSPAGAVRPAGRDTPLPQALAARWSTDDAVPAGGQITGRITFHTSDPESEDARLVFLTLRGATVADIPRACRSSATLKVHSSISADGRRLRCELWPTADESRTIRFRAFADPATPTDPATDPRPITGTVTTDDAVTVRLPPRPVSGSVDGTDAAAPTWRLLSSPDFLNGDVADLGDGPNFWRPGRTENSIDDDYRVAIGHVLDDWESLHPKEVLVAGDLVEGWWGTDATHSGNFGPVDTQAHRVGALERAAETVYRSTSRRFAEHGLDVRPAVGDHELGDDPWPAHKRALAASFRREFAKYVTEKPDGSPRYADHPTGENAQTAYAWRPLPDVQMITLDVFDITRKHARLRLDPDQFRWLRGVLARAKADGIRWILVQGHIPILEPVRVQGSTGLHYEPKAAPRLLKLFKRYGVDLYLCGEVHDTTATTRDGVTQITHGGAFQFGFTTYLLLDEIGDHLRLTLRDYRTAWHQAADGTKLWETRPLGLPKLIKVNPVPFTIGTADLTSDGDLVRRSGILLPYDPDAPGEHPPTVKPVEPR